MIALLLAVAAHPHPVPSGTPPDVAACIERGAIFIAKPDFFEELSFRHPDGRDERAFQVLDHHDGKTGHLLIFPATCKIVVLAVTPTGSGVETADLHAWGQSGAAEKQNLLRWARFVSFDEQNPAHAAWGVGATPARPLRWLPGKPVPQASAWRALDDGRWEIQRLARFSRPIAWEPHESPGLALWVYPGRPGEAALAVYDAHGDRFAVFAVVSVRAVDSRSIVWQRDLVRVSDPAGREHVLPLP